MTMKAYAALEARMVELDDELIVATEQFLAATDAVKTSSAKAARDFAEVTKASAAMSKVLEELGFIDTSGNSLFFSDKGPIHGGIFGFYNQAQADLERYGRTKFTEMAYSAFGQQGGRDVLLHSDPRINQVLKDTRKQMMAPSMSLAHQVKKIQQTSESQADTQLGASWHGFTGEIGAITQPARIVGLQTLAIGLQYLTGGLKTSEQFWADVPKNFKKAEDGAHFVFESIGKDVQVFGSDLRGAAGTIGTDLHAVGSGIENFVGGLAKHAIDAEQDWWHKLQDNSPPKPDGKPPAEHHSSFGKGKPPAVHHQSPGMGNLRDPHHRLQRTRDVVDRAIDRRFDEWLQQHGVPRWAVTPGNAPHQQQTVRHVHEHTITHQVAADTVKATVQKHIHEEILGHSDPRFLGGRSSTTVTHPSRPTTDSTHR